MKSTLGLAALGIFLAALWPRRADRRRATRSLLLCGAGAAPMVLLILIRNAVVGAPLFSLSSVATATLIGSNTPGFSPGEGWYPYGETALFAQILATSEGSFLPAWGELLRAHDGLWSYLALLAAKFASVFHWHEIPNNVNYYFTGLHSTPIGVLSLLVTTGWILAAGITGFWFAVVDRRRIGQGLWLLACLLGPMILFYCLSRFRAPMVVVLIPFAGYGLVSIVRGLLGTRRGEAAAVLLAGLGLLALIYRPIDPPRPVIHSGCYRLALRFHYLPRATATARGQDLVAARREFERMFAIEPVGLRDLGPKQLPTSDAECSVAGAFVFAYRGCARFAELDGDRETQRAYTELADRIMEAVRIYVETKRKKQDG